jgi:hypothetical protein
MIWLNRLVSGGVLVLGRPLETGGDGFWHVRLGARCPAGCVAYRPGPPCPVAEPRRVFWHDKGAGDRSYWHGSGTRVVAGCGTPTIAA